LLLRTVFVVVTYKRGLTEIIST